MFFDNNQRKVRGFMNSMGMLVAAPSIFFFGLAVQQYNVPDSFVRANVDQIVVFFLKSYPGQLIMNPQKYQHCITDAKANTPPADVLMCFIQ